MQVSSFSLRFLVIKKKRKKEKKREIYIYIHTYTYIHTYIHTYIGYIHTHNLMVNYFDSLKMNIKPKKKKERCKWTNPYALQVY